MKIIGTSKSRPVGIRAGTSSGTSAGTSGVCTGAGVGGACAGTRICTVIAITCAVTGAIHDAILSQIVVDGVWTRTSGVLGGRIRLPVTLSCFFHEELEDPLGKVVVLIERVHKLLKAEGIRGL